MDALTRALEIHGPDPDHPDQCRACSVDPVVMPWPCPFVTSLRAVRN
jgi:hypothetical protein